MSIVNFKKKGFIPRVNPNPQNVSEYSSRVDRLSKISMNLEGTPWVGDYIHQILAEDEDAKHLDVNLSAVNQSYSFISDMEIFVTEPLSTSTDDDSGVSTVSGGANVYGFLKPAIGDMFMVSLIEGGTGLLDIVTVETSGYNNRVHYAITYNLSAILEEDPVKFNNLKEKIKNNYVFDKRLIQSGNIPIITAKQGLSRGELSTLLNITIKDYLRDFIDIDTKTLLVPTTDRVRLYDDYLVEFMKHIVQRSGVPLSKEIVRYTVDDRSSSVTSIWTVLMDKAYLHTDVVANVIGVESRRSYTGNKVGSSMRYAPIDYIAKLDTDNKSPSWKHMHELLNITVPEHVISTDGVTAPVPVLPGAPIITTPSTPEGNTIPWVNPNPVVEKRIEIYIDGNVIAGPSGRSDFKESEVYDQLKTWIRPDGTVVDTVESMNRVGDTIYIFTSSYRYHSGSGIDLSHLGIAHTNQETLPNGDVVVTNYDKDNKVVSKETTTVDNLTSTTVTTDKDNEITHTKTVLGVEPNLTTKDYDSNLVLVATKSVSVDEETNNKTTIEKTFTNGVLGTKTVKIVDKDYKVIYTYEGSVLNPGDDLDNNAVAKHLEVTENNVNTVTDVSSNGTSVQKITAPNGSIRTTVTDPDGNTVSVETVGTLEDGSVETTRIEGNTSTVTTVTGNSTTSVETTTAADGSTVVKTTIPNLTTTVSKDPNGETLSILKVRPIGENTETRYDDVVANSSSVTITNPAGDVLSVVSVLANGDTTVTDDKGNTVEEIKDENGNVITKRTVSTSTDGRVTTSVYDGSGALVSKTILFKDLATGITTVTVITGSMRYTTVTNAEGERIRKTTLVTTSVTETVKTTYGATDNDLISVMTITTDGTKVTSVAVEGSVVTTTVEVSGNLTSKGVSTTDDQGVVTEVITGPTDEVIVTSVTTGQTTVKTYPDKVVVVTTYPAGNVRELVRFNGSNKSVEYYKNANGKLIDTTHRTYDVDDIELTELIETNLTGKRLYTERNSENIVTMKKEYNVTPTTKTIKEMNLATEEILYTVTAYRDSYSSVHIGAIDDGGATLDVTEGMLFPFADLMKSELATALAAEEADRGGVDLITVVKNPSPDSYTIVGGITNSGSSNQ